MRERFRYSTNSTIPPLKRNVSSRAGSSWEKWISTPPLRKASSRSRLARMSHSKCSVVKIWLSGKNVTLVPVPLVFPMIYRPVAGWPRSKRWWYTFPSRRTSTSSHSLRAFTHDTPTPCKPPETL